MGRKDVRGACGKMFELLRYVDRLINLTWSLGCCPKPDMGTTLHEKLGESLVHLFWAASRMKKLEVI